MENVFRETKKGFNFFLRFYPTFPLIYMMILSRFLFSRAQAPLFVTVKNTSFPEKSIACKSVALQILQYCSAHFKEDITVESVAKALHISRSSISHTFSNRVSMSFNDYINSLRLDKACQYLKNKSLSITETSDLSGFPTVRTFNRAFLKKYNTTPTEYRKTN